MDAEALDLKLRMMQQKLEITRAQVPPPAHTAAAPQPPPAAVARPPVRAPHPPAPQQAISAVGVVARQQREVENAIDEALEIERQLALARRRHQQKREAAAAAERAAKKDRRERRKREKRERQEGARGADGAAHAEGLGAAPDAARKPEAGWAAAAPSETPFEASMRRTLERQTELLGALVGASGRAADGGGGGAAAEYGGAGPAEGGSSTPGAAEHSAISRLVNKQLIGRGAADQLARRARAAATAKRGGGQRGGGEEEGEGEGEGAVGFGDGDGGAGGASANAPPRAASPPRGPDGRVLTPHELALLRAMRRELQDSDADSVGSVELDEHASAEEQEAARRRRAARAVVVLGGLDLCLRVVFFVAKLRALVNSAPRRAAAARAATARLLEANTAAAQAWLRRAVRVVVQSVLNDGPGLSLELRRERGGGGASALSAGLGLDLPSLPGWLGGGSGGGGGGGGGAGGGGAGAGASAAPPARSAGGGGYAGPVMRLRVRSRAILEALLERTPEQVPPVLLAFCRAYTGGAIPQLARTLLPSELEQLSVSAQDGSVKAPYAWQRRSLLINLLITRLLVLRLVAEPAEHQISASSGRKPAPATRRNLRTPAAVLYALACVAMANRTWRGEEEGGAGGGGRGAAEGARARSGGSGGAGGGEGGAGGAGAGAHAGLGSAGAEEGGAASAAAAGGGGSLSAARLSELLQSERSVYEALQPEIGALEGAAGEAICGWLWEGQFLVLRWAARLDAAAAEAAGGRAQPAGAEAGTPAAPPAGVVREVSSRAPPAARLVSRLASSRAPQHGSASQSQRLASTRGGARAAPTATASAGSGGGGARRVATGARAPTGSRQLAALADDTDDDSVGYDTDGRDGG